MASIAVGCVGNVLAGVVVVTTPELWKNTLSLYILALAVVDTAYLLSSQMIVIINYFTQEDLFSDTVAAILIVYFWLTLPMVDAWVIVTISLERLIAVVYPMKVRVLFTKKRALSGLGVTLLACGLFPIFLAILANKSPEGLLIFYLVLSYGLPSLLLTVNGTGIMFMVKRIRRKRSMLGLTSGIHVTHMTVMMVVIVLEFIIISGSIWVYILYYYYSLRGNPFPSSAARYSFLSISLHSWHYVANFYIYCATNKIFRESLKAKCRQCLRRN